jgi:hypothetical protein
MTYAIAILRASVQALKNAKIHDQRIKDLEAAIRALQQ